MLFMNKSDILEKKLKAGVHFATQFPRAVDEPDTGVGVRFADHVEQYREQPNDFDNVSNCALAPADVLLCRCRLITLADIRKILLAIHKECSPRKRPLHTHMTCATVSPLRLSPFQNWIQTLLQGYPHDVINPD